MSFCWYGRARGRKIFVSSVGAILLTCAAGAGSANAEGATGFGDIETEELFGFTDGSGIGLQGETEFSADTEAFFGRRDGHYATSETKLEIEHTPTQFVEFEFGALASAHSIKNVTGLDDRSAFNFMGLFAEFNYLAIERTSSSPLSVTLSAEPTWRRIDETSGEPVTNFELETKVKADLELVPNRLYLGSNLLYEPEWTTTAAGEFERESTFGISGALAYRVTPPLVIGMDLWYYRHYDGNLFETFTGDAVFLGPTLFYQISNKAFVRAAWEAQIAGHAVGDPAGLNLADFWRQRAKLKLAVEF